MGNGWQNSSFHRPVPGSYFCCKDPAKVLSTLPEAPDRPMKTACLSEMPFLQTGVLPDGSTPL